MTYSFREYQDHAWHILLASEAEQQVTSRVENINIREPPFLSQSKPSMSPLTNIYESEKRKKKGLQREEFCITHQWVPTFRLSHWT